MDLILAAAIGVAYSLVAARVGYVVWRINPKGGAFLLGMLWPLGMVILGFGTMVSGNAGFYDSSHRRS